jgi:ribosome-binding protein aMBF1 (putative translation factor)
VAARSAPARPGNEKRDDGRWIIAEAGEFKPLDKEIKINRLKHCSRSSTDSRLANRHNLAVMPKHDKALSQFGCNVSRFRDQAGLSQDKLAEKLNSTALI